MPPDTDWIQRFEGLAKLEPELRRVLTERGRIVAIPEGTVLFGPGKAPESLILLLDGVVRVQQVADTGREIVLYRVHAGESCVLTTACLLAYEDYLAEGIAETAVRAVAIPRAVFDDLVAGSPVFRRFVFTAYSRRITDLFLVIQEVAFRRIDIRLAQKLLELAGEAGRVSITHHDLATELGTAREVVSRQLGEFGRHGWVAATRGHIEILDRRALAALGHTP